jgi:hypothetical protein
MRGKTSLAILAVAALAVWAAPAALAVNYSYPATYTGSTEAGGTVSFETAADGTSVTRFVVAGVPSLCGLEESSTTGRIPIYEESFSYTAIGTGASFSGSFTGPQQAAGNVSVRVIGFPSCSASTRWTATTPTPPRDETAPQTKIKSGPSGSTSSKKAKFKFSSSEGGSKFQCKLDGKAWGSCKSPKTYKGLKPGRHTFRVRATDQAGNRDPSPAKRSWRVKD